MRTYLGQWTPEEDRLVSQLSLRDAALVLAGERTKAATKQHRHRLKTPELFKRSGNKNLQIWTAEKVTKLRNNFHKVERMTGLIPLFPEFTFGQIRPNAGG